MSDLLIRLKLDDKGLDAQMKGVSSKFAGLAKDIAAITLPLAAVAAIAKAVDGLANIGEAAIKSIAPLQDVSARLGVTAERLQELRLVAGNAGVSTETLDKALETLSRNIGNSALGKGDLGKTLDAVGLSLRDNAGHVKSTAQVWDELSAKIQSGALTQEKAAGLTAAAFGKGSAAMIAALKQTAEEQQRVIDTARQFGAIISNEVVAAADEYDDKLALIKKGTEALGAQNDLILAPLTLRWATLKNEITFAVAGMARAVGLIDNNTTLMAHDAKQLEEQIALIRANLESQGLQAADDPLLQKLVKQWADLKKNIKDADEAAKQASAVANPGAAADAGDDPQLLTEIKVNALRIEAMKSFSDVWLQDVQWQLDQEITTNATRLETNQDFLTTLAAQNEAYRKANLSAVQRDWEERQALWNAETTTAADRTASILGSIVELTEGRAQNDKKSFDLNKKAAIAEATINAYRAIQQVWADGNLNLYAKIAATAFTAAQTLQNVKAIKSTSFTGSGGGTTPSAAGGATVNGAPVSNQVITLRGIDANQLFSGRQLVDLLNKATSDGAKLVVQQ